MPAAFWLIYHVVMRSLTTAESRVVQAIDEHALVNSLRDLVRVPSITGSAAESDLQHQLARMMIEAGLDVDLWHLDLEALRNDPRFPGTEVNRSEGYGVVGVTSTDGPPALVLQGHVDVVPIGDQRRWQGSEPFSGKILGNTLYGRGACDMKAGLGVNLEVARAFHRSGVRLRRPLGLHAVISEEDGGLGAFATVLRGHVSDAAVITEPTGGKVVTASAGALTFQLKIAGRAAHGSVRLEGHSAFEAFLPVYAALAELERQRNIDPDQLFVESALPYPISVGRIRAGDWSSSVPDILEAEGRYGVRLDEDVVSAREEFETAIRAASEADPWLRRNPVEVTWPGGQFASGRISPGDPLIGQVSDAIADVTHRSPSPPAAVSYGSDLRIYANIGNIPTLHYGPGDVRFAHAPREQVQLTEVIEAAQVMALLAARKCGAYL